MSWDRSVSHWIFNPLGSEVVFSLHSNVWIFLVLEDDSLVWRRNCALLCKCVDETRVHSQRFDFLIFECGIVFEHITILCVAVITWSLVNHCNLLSKKCISTFLVTLSLRKKIKYRKMSLTSHAFTVKTWCTWGTEHSWVALMNNLTGLFNQIHSYVNCVLCKVLFFSDWMFTFLLETYQKIQGQQTRVIE